MRLYRFGYTFKTVKELAAVLGLTPYGGVPTVMPSGEVAPSFLSERDIINRMIKYADAKNEDDARERFIRLVSITYPDKVPNNEGDANELKQSNANISAG